MLNRGFLTQNWQKQILLMPFRRFQQTQVEEIKPYQQASMVYNNIDRSEETLSGAGTTHRVNGKAFNGSKLPQN